MKNKDLVNKGISAGVVIGAAIFGQTKKNWKPLAGVVALHTAEYLAVGRSVGKAAGKSEGEIAVNSLIFGVAWWKPLSDELKEAQKKAEVIAELEKEGLVLRDKFADKGCGVRFADPVPVREELTDVEDAITE